MRKVLRTGLIAWAGLIFAPSVQAESVNLLASEYKPLINTKAGRIETCGVHFAAVVRTLDGRLLSIQGSTNSSFFKDKVPGLMIKVSASEVLNKNLDMAPRKIQFASFRVDQTDTLIMKGYPSEDGNSVLLITDAIQAGEFVVVFPELFYKGAWVSVSLDKAQSDYTFRLPAFGADDLDTMKQVADCNLVGINAFRRETEAMPK